VTSDNYDISRVSSTVMRKVIIEIASFILISYLANSTSIAQSYFYNLASTDSIKIKSALNYFSKNPKPNTEHSLIVSHCGSSIFERCQYKIMLKDCHNIKLVQTDNNDSIFNVMDCGYLPKNTMIYHDNSEFKHIFPFPIYSKFYILVDDIVEYNDWPLSKCELEDNAFQIYAGVIDSAIMRNFINNIDSLLTALNNSRGMIIYPNCTLFHVSGGNDSITAKPEFEFSVNEDSTWTALVLLSDDNKYIRLLFQLWLNRGRYFVYFNYNDDQDKPLVSGKYRILLNRNNKTEFTDFSVGN
jgi:hypothetical protein